MANECIPLFKPGEDVTCYATAAVTGKRFVNVSADRQTSGTATGDLISVAPASAAGDAFGVAAYDAAINTLVAVVTDGIVPVTAGGTVTAGQRVEIDASGRAVTLASGIAVAKAVSSATSGNDVFVQLRLS